MKEIAHLKQGLQTEKEAQQAYHKEKREDAENQLAERRAEKGEEKGKTYSEGPMDAIQQAQAVVETGDEARMQEEYMKRIHALSVFGPKLNPEVKALLKTLVEKSATMLPSTTVPAAVGLSGAQTGEEHAAPGEQMAQSEGEGTAAKWSKTGGGKGAAAGGPGSKEEKKEGGEE